MHQHPGKREGGISIKHGIGVPLKLNFTSAVFSRPGYG